MTLADSAAQRGHWLTKLAHVQSEIRDLQLELDVAVLARPSRDTIMLLAQADVHCEQAIKELDESASRIRRIV